MFKEETKEKPVEKKKKERTGKKPHKNKPSSQKYKKYKIVDGKIIREKTCPRCGPGVFLMNSKNRLYCGKCHYTEFISESKKE
ncbi:MAG: 30S ribosomal protein S27ae [Nanoarchaeota archaeon]|nr:30S ribosomal protein S27ae [Nanoarchaeota archaeon]